MFGLGLGRMGLVGDLGFAIRRSLFGRGEQGLWYDLNDDATIFQDSAGTTLATWGDPVGLVLDKHESDGRGVVNRILFSQQLDNPNWLKSNISVSADTTLAPDGTTTADTVTGLAGTALKYITHNTDAALNSALATFTIFAKEGTHRFIQVSIGGDASKYVNFDLNGSGATAAFGSGVTSSVTAASNGFLRVQVTLTGAASTNRFFISLQDSLGAAREASTASTSTIILWGGQSQLGSTAAAYQANGASVGGAGNHTIQATAGSRPIRGRMPKRGRINELVSTATMATQNVTVTAAQRTLSFTGTGTVTLSGASTAGPLIGTGASNRVSLTFTPSAGTLTLTVTGSVTLAQLQLGAAFDNYQAVNDGLGFNVTEAGQPSCGYLSFNGSNQWMQTAASVNFSATDEMSVFAGVLKRSAAGTFGMIAEHTVSAAANNGAFYVAAPGSVSSSTDNYSFLTRGTTNFTGFDAVTFTSPHYSVLSSVIDNGAATRALQVLPRVNGAIPTLNAGGAAATGAGNYANAVTYFGARAGTTQYFNGLMFSTIIRGALTSGTLLTRTEQYVARQTPTVSL